MPGSSRRYPDSDTTEISETIIRQTHHHLHNTLHRSDSISDNFVFNISYCSLCELKPRRFNPSQLLSDKNNPRSNWLAIKTKSYTPKNSGGQRKGPVKQEVLEAKGWEKLEPGPHDAYDWPCLWTNVVVMQMSALLLSASEPLETRAPPLQKLNSSFK